MSIHAPVPELYVSSDSAAKLKVAAGSLPSWDLTARQVCDLELLMNGGFYPLKGFQSQADYISTVETMRTSDGAGAGVLDEDAHPSVAQRAADGALHDEGVRVCARAQEIAHHRSATRTRASEIAQPSVLAHGFGRAALGRA